MSSISWTVVSWTVVARAALIGSAVVAAPAVVASALLDDASGSITWLFLVLALAGFLAAGWTAGQTDGATPMLHGALAALATYAVVQIAGVIRRIVGGDDVEVVAVGVTALLSLCCGVGGALAADWFRRRRMASDAAHTISHLSE